MGIEVGIVLTLLDNLPMRDYCRDINGFWVDAVKILRSKLFDRGLQMCDPTFSRFNASPNMRRFGKKIEHRNGQNDEFLHDHLK
jgi:hypothetical protein